MGKMYRRTSESVDEIGAPLLGHLEDSTGEGAKEGHDSTLVGTVMKLDHVGAWDHLSVVFDERGGEGRNNRCQRRSDRGKHGKKEI